MPQESRPSDIPSVSDVEDEVAGIENPQDNNAVRNALQDIVLFAQDFLNVLDDLVREPAVPRAIHIPRPLRPAGRFVLQARAGGNFQRPVRPAARLIRPAILLRPLILGGNFDEPLQPGDVPVGDAGLHGRGVHLGHHFRDPIHPDDMNAEVAGPANVGAEVAGPADVGAEVAGQANVGAEVAGSATVGAEVAGSATVGAEVAGSATVGAEVAGSATVGAEVAGSATVGAEVAGSANVGADFAGSAAVDEADRIAAVKAEAVQPASEWVQPEVIGGEFNQAEAMRAEAIHIPVVESAKPVTLAVGQESDVPVPIKRARLDNLEGGSSKQREEGVLHYRSMETSDDSSESNGDQ